MLLTEHSRQRLRERSVLQRCGSAGQQHQKAVAIEPELSWCCRKALRTPSIQASASTSRAGLLRPLVGPKLGSRAYATLYGSTTRVPVRLRQLSGAADPQTRTFEARYILEGAAANAPLGATVTVHLSGSVGTHLLQVPVASVLDQGKGPGIWLLKPTRLPRP